MSPFLNFVGTQAEAGATDPFFSNVVLLCGFEDADGSTTLIDETGRHTITAGGNAQIDTAQSKFGAASLLLDGTGDYANVALSGLESDFLFGTGDFTIETFVRFDTGFGNDETFINKWSNVTSSQNAWFFYRQGGTLRFLAKNAAVSIASGAWSASTGVWYHVAVDRDAADKIRLYIDGAMVASGTSSADINEINANVGLGSIVDSGGSFNPLNGWLDEVRITKGVARYASDGGYTVPTAPFPRS